MKRKIKKIFATGLVILFVSTMPAMAYTNDTTPFEFMTGNNIDIHVGDNADLILAKLGEPKSSGKIGSGDEAWYYDYDNYVIYTSKPGKGKETVTGVDIAGSGEQTKEGLGINSTEAEMSKRYGNKGDSKYNKNIDATTYTYKKGDSILDVIINCYNKVIRISYR